MYISICKCTLLKDMLFCLKVVPMAGAIPSFQNQLSVSDKGKRILSQYVFCFPIKYVFDSTCIPSIFVTWKKLFEIKRCMLVNLYSVDILVSDIERIISPPNIYMHRKCEVPGSKCRFTSRN